MRKRKAEERRNTLIALGLLALIFLLFAVLAVRPGVIIPMTEASYGSSLGSAVGGGRGGECSPTRYRDKMVCGVETHDYSGIGPTVVLRKTARGCWNARWVRGDRPPLEGCVGLLDLVHPNEPDGTY